MIYIFIDGNMDIITLVSIQNFINIRHPGGKCIALKYKNNETKMPWLCEYNHVWEANWSDIKSNKWCPFCNGRFIPSIEYINNFAEAEHNGKCLSLNYINAHTKMKWQCSKGYIWDANWNKIYNSKKWCPHCAKNLKPTIEEIKSYIDENHKNSKCLDEVYVNSKTKMNWQCQNGHSWKACWLSIRHAKSWCPNCLSKTHHTLASIQEHINQYHPGGKCLSNIYINSSEKMSFECEHKHKWETNWTSIFTGNSWCPKCIIRYGEKCCKYIFEELFQTKFEKIRPDWLKNPMTKCKLELDGFCENLKLAFEYQGQQHYKFVKYFHRNQSSLEYQQYKDNYKKQKCNELNITLIQVPHLSDSFNINDMKIFITNKCIENNIELPIN
ncbi:MAG: hypothetical protein ACOYO1_05145 [Bacteroidales bacterium]